jgi:2-keto-3-deoxy-galactonokinase
MADHIATAQRYRARGYRARAAKCELSAKATSSAEFGECYRLLAKHYLVLANLEEDCAQRPSPFARQRDNKAAEPAAVRSVAARMFAVRQMQLAAPSTETVSMPPMSVVAIPAAEFGR